MKKLIPEEQRPKILSAITIMAAGVAMLFVLIYIQNIWGMIKALVNVAMPFIVGICLAFIQVPIVNKLENFFTKRVFRKHPHQRAIRILCTFISLFIVLGLIAAFLVIVLPKLLTSIEQLIYYITVFINENSSTISTLLLKYDFITIEGDELVIMWENILSSATDYISLVLENIMSISSVLIDLVIQIFVGFVSAFYILMDKERLCAKAKKICYALFKKNTCEVLIKWTRRANYIFTGFISGKIVDSLIIGVLCYLGMNLFNFEYSLLISVIICFTNVIPYFGPFIGAIPSVLILLIVNPISAVEFAIFILALQQIDGNIIGPLILKDYVGLSSLWIMIAIVVGGGLFGFAGMLLSVPVFSLVYAIIKSVVELRLLKKGYPTSTDDFVNIPPKDLIAGKEDETSSEK